MIRNLKVLGLALAAVFALSAAIASSAFAETEGALTVDGPVTLKGTEIGTGENFFEGVVNVECPGSTFEGTSSNGATSISTIPTYVNCNHPVDTEGCNYRLFDSTTTGGVAGTYGVSVEICPNVNKAIKVTISPCAFLVTPKQVVTGFHLTNTAGSPDDLVLSGQATVHGTACGFPATATQHQNVTIKGTNSTGGTTGITITHN